MINRQVNAELMTHGAIPSYSVNSELNKTHNMAADITQQHVGFTLYRHDLCLVLYLIS